MMTTTTINFYTVELFGEDRIPLATSKEELSQKEIHKQMLLHVGATVLTERIEQWEKDNPDAEEEKPIAYTHEVIEVSEEQLTKMDANFSVEKKVL